MWFLFYFSGHSKKKTGLVVEEVEEQTEYSQLWKIWNQSGSLLLIRISVIFIDMDYSDFYWSFFCDFHWSKFLKHCSKMTFYIALHLNLTERNQSGLIKCKVLKLAIHNSYCAYFPHTCVNMHVCACVHSYICTGHISQTWKIEHKSVFLYNFIVQ